MNAPRLAGLVVLAGFAGVMIWAATRPPSRPESPRIVEVEEIAEERIESGKARDKARADFALVRQLLQEDLDSRRFHFPLVVLACSEKKVVPLDAERAAHRRVLDAIDRALAEATVRLGAEGSPLHELRRINEASRFFEDALMESIDRAEGLSCGVPVNRAGDSRRSGYPDLRVVDEASGEVFYLDPKLVERDSWDSSFRSFYFAPKDETLKVTEDAVHLLIGIGHDGNDGAWKFGAWKVVDLSTLTVRLKAEFQASNRDLYPAE